MTSFAADTTGSYRRPKRLLEAREKKFKKEISDLELQKIEDEEIKTLVEKQVAAGLRVVCDGEFRRSRFVYFYFFGFFLSYVYDFWAPFGDIVSGDDIFPNYPNVGAVKHLAEVGIENVGSATKPFGVYVKGKISYNPNHPEFRAFEYLKSVTPEGIIPKVRCIILFNFFLFLKVVVATPNFLLVFRDWKKDKWPSYV
jgi:methionine synthase II (cobalamin-independent)